MKMKKIAKYFKPFVLSVILLLSVGCTDSNEKSESVQNIRAVLQEELNGPDEELEKIWDGLFSDNKDKGEFEKYIKRRSEYLEEHFKQYVSERFYDAYAIKGNMAIGFLWEAYRNNYELKVEDITIEESKTTENSYGFNAEVSYTKEGNNDHNTINIRGLMNTNEEGKIVRIRYHNRSELKQVVGSFAKGHIQFVLYKKYNTHERMNRVFKNDTSSIEDYVEDILMPHYSERVDETEVKSTSLFIQEIAYKNDYKLKTEDITFEESETTENAYDFNVNLSYKKKGGNDHKTINLKGVINTDEKGKIVRFQLHNDKKLLDALRK